MSLGTLGGGNHFIELDVNEEGALHVVIHSGSRHLGKEVTEYYLSEGQKYLKEKGIQIPKAHNYMDTIGEEMILRKGAISAKRGESVIIPINMRDGILLGIGLGNEDGEV